MHKFGSKSLERLNTCESDLFKIMNLVISRSHIDFSITEGHRSIDRQQQLFEDGKSKIDGINKKGKHNYFPSRAVDIAIYHADRQTRNRLVYHVPSLSYIAGVVQSCTEELFEKGEIKHRVRWGGNWDKDGIILQDQSFDDLPHFELY